MKKRIFILITVIFLLTPLFTTVVSAKDLNNIIRSVEFPLIVNRLSTESGEYSGSFYNQLSAEQKNVYNEMNPMPTTNTDIEFDLITPLTYTLSGNTITEGEMEDIGDLIRDIVEPTLNAYLSDNPIVFWLDLRGDPTTSTSYLYTYYETTSGGKTTWTIAGITIRIKVASVYSEFTTSTYKDAVLNEIDDFDTDSASRYDILKDIHDYLCNNVVYSSSAIYAHEPYGSLVDGKAVCEGYAEAFKLLCDKYNIPCVLVVGDGVTNSGTEPHMWNYVQMENDNWYGVDVTWDDQNVIRYDFFLAGADTVSVNFGTKTFSQSHIENGSFFSEYSKVFVFPDLNPSAYVKPDPGDAVLKSESNLSISGSYMTGLYDDMTVGQIKAQFTGEITVENSDGVLLADDEKVGTGCIIDVGSVSYTAIVLGDVDGNGTITARDYLLVKRAFLGTFTLSEEQNKAACVGGGTSPVSSDYLKVKRHVLGTYDIFKRAV
ncbi:MAG: transglutaminase domain-containing protein [Eubacteriales bacterium]|nr:transglutaminase domain-containing protein [Eubacteriales bacterium]